MINPSFDVWVWLVAGVFLALVAARAWVVETGQGRLGRTPAKVQVLTGSIAGVLVLLVALLAVQGGALLVESIVTKTNPATAYYEQQQNEDPGVTPAVPDAPAGG